jgi:DNA polymerase I-like protein with 3'-5' exonuclease and polymerase domains
MAPIPSTRWEVPKYFPNLSSAPFIGLDVERKDLHLLKHGPGWARGDGHLVGLSVAVPGQSWYFPFRHEVEPEHNLDPAHVLAWARDSLSNPYQDKIGANLIYDIGALRDEGVNVAGRLVDVQFAEALLEERGKVGLGVLGEKYLGHGKVTNALYDWCWQSYGGKRDDQRENIYRAPGRLVGPYAEADAMIPLQVIGAQYQRLVSEGLLDLFFLECALIPLLVDMRFAGVSVNIPRAEQVRDRLVQEEQAARERLLRVAGFAVETNSAASIARAFKAHGLPIKYTEAGNPSFEHEDLESVDHPIATEIINCRKYEKFRGTFVEGYILNGHVGGKVFGSFHPLRADANGTRSGRLSSARPNLQNIPVRDDVWGPILRSLFIPDPGHEAWRKYDYSQIEYRGLVHYAVGRGADEARSKYHADPKTDFHEFCLALVGPAAGWDISTKELRKKWRKPVKGINFGLVFGMGEDSLAGHLHMVIAAAKVLFAAYHNALPFVKATMNATAEEVQRLGYITTILGRRSRFDLWEPKGKHSEDAKPLPYQQAVRVYGTNLVRAFGYVGLNRRLQGTAADLLKVALYKCYYGGIFAATGVPRLTVHDELCFSDPGGKAEAFREMKHVMETAIPLRVPVIAEGEIGPNWGECRALAA